MRKTDEDKKKVTQNDVAKAAGVTRSMVSYVISGTSERSVAPETRKRILEVIQKLGYRPNKAAQALQLGDVAFASKNIGVVLPNSDLFLRPFYTEILEGIFTAAHEHNYNIKFIRFFRELKDPVLFNELIHPESIGSLILLAVNQAIKDEEDEKSWKKPANSLKKQSVLNGKRTDLQAFFLTARMPQKKLPNILSKRGSQKLPISAKMMNEFLVFNRYFCSIILMQYKNISILQKDLTCRPATTE